MAVSILIGTSQVGSIALFARAKGQPKIVKGYGEIYFVTYDAKGNLFGDGMDARSAFALFELPAGSRKLVPLKVHGAVVEFPGNVQYTNDVLNIVDQGVEVNYETRVKGSTAAVVGKTELRGSGDCNATYIYNDRLLCADMRHNDLTTYQYPKGGRPLRTYDIDAFGVVVSIDSK